MKICTMITTILLSGMFTTAKAANYFPVGKAGAKTTYTKKELCESVEGQECFEISSIAPAINDVIDVQVDDVTKPVYSAKVKVLACTDKADCYLKIEPVCTGTGPARICLGYCQASPNPQPNSYMPIVAADFSQVYCTSVTGYQQKWVKQLQENATKKSARDAANVAKASLEASIAQGAKDMAFGKRMIALMAAVVKAKNLNLADTKLTLADLADARALLDVGSIDKAKLEITAYVPDGVRVIVADKTAILAEINKYLGL